MYWSKIHKPIGKTFLLRSRSSKTSRVMVPTLWMRAAKVTSQASDSDAFAGAFERLHPEIRRWIYQQRWTELREVQARAIDAILGSESDVVISAATAAGKTEAAFLPILTQVAD